MANKVTSDFENDIKVFVAALTIISAVTYAFTIGYLDEHLVYAQPSFIDSAKFFVRTIVFPYWYVPILSAGWIWGAIVHWSDARSTSERALVLGCLVTPFLWFASKADLPDIRRFGVGLASLALVAVPAVLVVEDSFRLRMKRSVWIRTITGTWAFCILAACGLGHWAARESITYPVIGDTLLLWSGEAGQYFLECSSDRRPAILWRKDDSSPFVRARDVRVEDRQFLCRRHFQYVR
ncbi:MAG: hypothetical protein AB7T49_03620 [Oligoflexales bacterium]